MNRIVLVSDPTKEFPNNTTSSFKVRLPVPLTLKGEGWNVGLAAMSTPDAALDLARLTNAVNLRVVLVGVKMVNNLRTDDIPYHHQTVVQIKDLTNDPSVVDGVSLMKALIGKSQFYEMKEAQSKSKRQVSGDVRMGRRGPAHSGQGVGRHRLDHRHGVTAMACAREHG